MIIFCFNIFNMIIIIIVPLKIDEYTVESELRIG